jgi:hypothetical protein
MGYHCWALGFLDTQGRRVGCLLHPNQNQGQDLRFLIDYGNKCDREHCSAARMFELLPVEGRRFWLPLVRGMNSFYFSSPRSNPLFHILHWGPKVLESLRLGAIKKHWTASELLCEEPFLLDPLWKPKVHRYLFRLGIESLHGHEAEGPPLDQFCRKLLRRIVSSAEARTLPETDNHTNYTHLLPLEDDFLDFLRLGLGWRKSSLHQAIELKNRTHDLVF